MAPPDQDTLKSSEKSFAIINGLLDLGEAGVTDLADLVPFHKSTVYVHLQTMRENGLVDKSGKKYRLSLRFLTISEKIRNQRAVYQEGAAEIERLATQTGELACLGVPENGDVVIVCESQGEKGIQNIGIGARLPITESALGKAMLAFVADSSTNEEESNGIPSEFKDATEKIDSDDELIAELEAARRDGFLAAEDELNQETPYIAEPNVGSPRSESHQADIRNQTVAAPIQPGDEPVGTVAVTGPKNRISGDYLTDIREQVINTSELIEQKMTVTKGIS